MFQPELQPTSFKELVELIYRCRAFSVIKMMVEEYRVLFDDNPEQRALLDAINASDDGDEIELLCARFLGHEQRVQELTEWLKTKPPRTSLLSPDIGERYVDSA